MKVTINDFDKYQNNASSAGYFTLKNDGDSAFVRFLYESSDEISGEAVHQVTVDGKRRYVSCLRELSDAKDVCPLCAHGDGDEQKVSVRMWLDMYVYDKDERGNIKPTYTRQVWERGRAYLPTILGLCARYSPICDTVFEIVRHGKAGDAGTRYDIFPCTRITAEEAPYELPEEAYNPVGNIVLDKTAAEMEVFINTGSFGESEGVTARPQTTYSRGAEPVRTAAHEPEQDKAPWEEPVVPAAPVSRRRRV